MSLVGLVAILAFAGTPALAETTRPFEADFGPDGTAGTAFGEPAALGIDQATGDTYVEDAAAGTVEKFNAAHEPAEFTGLTPEIVAGRLTGFHFPPASFAALNQLVVDSTTHDFYVVDAPAVKAYQANGEPADFAAGPSVGTNELPAECGVTVDSSGNIYIGEFSSVQIDAPSGEPLVTIPEGTFQESACNVAVDSHGAVYVSHFNGSVEKLVPSEFPVTAATTYSSAGVVDANTSWGVTVDPTTNHLYADEHSQVAEYDEAGVRLGSFGAGGADALAASEGLAINSVSGLIYVSDAEGTRQVETFGPAVVIPDVTAEEATEVHPMSASLNGAVNPDGFEVTDCHFDYGLTTAYGQSAPCVETVGSGTELVEVHAAIAGLDAGTTYHFRLSATNANGTNVSADETVSTQPPPAIDAASVANLSATAADLNARIDPNGVDTTYRIEYGTSTAYGTSAPVPDEDIGEGAADVAVTQHITGLSADTTYHWRVIAHSEAGATTGRDHTFIYPQSGGGLPDNRAYEMVTPPQKNAALIGDVENGPPAQIADDGSRLVLGTLQCLDDARACTAVRGESLGSLIDLSRTAGGWSPTSLSPPATEFETSTWWLYSPDENTALYSMPTAPGGEDDFYARRSDGNFQHIGRVSPPLESASLDFEVVQAAQAKAATADLSHVVYETLSVWPPLNSEPVRKAVYEYSGVEHAAPSLVGVAGGPGSTDLISTCETDLANEKDNATAPLSTDGRVEYFTALPAPGSPCPAGAFGPIRVPELFARVDNAEGDAHTVAISEPKVVSASEPDEACTSVECTENISKANEETTWREATFQGAADNGSKAIFISEQQLTDNARQGSPNLYEFDGATAPSSSNRHLIDISEGATSPGGPRVQGVVALSPDGSHVYFVAKGVLTSAPNGQGAVAQDEADNLYVYEHDESHPGHLEFITSLVEADKGEWSGSAERTANVTPDGRFLVFTSHGLLTQDDSRADGGAQVFRYDAATGQLARVSIGDNGFNDNGNAGAGDAFIVPGSRGYLRAGAPRTDPTMSNDGSYVFFMTPVALTPGALSSVPINATEYAQNIYEYHDGSVHLISDGHDTSATQSEACPGSSHASSVCLIGSDTSGKNVFFSTTDQLVEQDTDTQLDIYDARVCEPEAGNPCLTPAVKPSPPCLGEACHGTPSAVTAAPSVPTTSFNGAGNLTPTLPPPAKSRTTAQIKAEKLAKALKVCHRMKHRKKRVTCEKRARKMYGPRKTTKSAISKKARHHKAGR